MNFEKQLQEIFESKEFQAIENEPTMFHTNGDGRYRPIYKCLILNDGYIHYFSNLNHCWNYQFSRPIEDLFQQHIESYDFETAIEIQGFKVSNSNIFSLPDVEGNHINKRVFNYPNDVEDMKQFMKEKMYWTLFDRKRNVLIPASKLF